MSFAKADYIETPVSTKPSKVAVKREVKNSKREKAESLSGLYLTFHLVYRYGRFVYRHRVGFLMASNAVLVGYLVAHHMGKI